MSSKLVGFVNYSLILLVILLWFLEDKRQILSLIPFGRCDGLMVGMLDSGCMLDTGQGHCVVFLGKTLHSHSASLHVACLHVIIIFDFLPNHLLP